MQFTNWRKPSRSNGTGNCVEVGTAPGRVGVRDSKNREGGVIAVPVGTWISFVADIRAGKFDI